MNRQSQISGGGLISVKLGGDVWPVSQWSEGRFYADEQTKSDYPGGLISVKLSVDVWPVSENPYPL